ncbi:replication-relaxation family protein [Robertmurraya beringensis]|uniref:Replication-relaxation family protein n=1 Tax=Robertmurraya beringensis TaxID=641660 RepID=A0ABV6KTX1_9BACI
MEDKKRIYLFNGQRVWITNKDLNLLLLIWKHRVLSLGQVQFYLRSRYQDSQNSIYQKLIKWNHMKIVTTEGYTEGKNLPYKCVRIAKNGMEILKKEGVKLDSDYNYKTLKIPKHATADHFFGTREVIVRFNLLAAEHDFHKFVSVHPIELPYNDINEVKTFEQHVTPGAKLTPMVTPDWILISDHAILNIESDTGSEYSDVIVEKVKKYVDYVTQGLHSKDHHVLIVPPDSYDDDILTYVKPPPKDRSKRLGTLKDYIIRASAHIIPNLHFHVVSSSRSGIVAYNILSGQYRNRTEELSKVLGGFRDNPNLCEAVEEINPSTIYGPSVEEALYADQHLLITGKDGISILVLVKLMEEGSVKSLDELELLNYLVKNDRLEKKVDKILAVYLTDNELQHDALGERWDLQHVLFTSIQQLNKNGKSGAIFYRSVKPLKKSRCTLYEG